jgi:hypothetical protein
MSTQLLFTKMIFCNKIADSYRDYPGGKCSQKNYTQSASAGFYVHLNKALYR